MGKCQFTKFLCQVQVQNNITFKKTFSAFHKQFPCLKISSSVILTEANCFNCVLNRLCHKTRAQKMEVYVRYTCFNNSLAMADAFWENLAGGTQLPYFHICIWWVGSRQRWYFPSKEYSFVFYICIGYLCLTNNIVK